MANQLKMAQVQSILTLHAQGWSGRRIARELHVDRETVWRWVCLARNAPPAAAGGANPANAPIFAPGSGPPDPADHPSGGAPPIGPAGSAGPDHPSPANAPIPAPGSAAPNPANAPILAPGSVTALLARTPASAGRASDCAAWREVIQAKRDQGLSAQRIHQDLVDEHQATVSYDSVRRFLRKLGWAKPLPFRRLECAPGVEAQVDFGTGAPIVDAEGKRRKTHVFRIVLSHSRKASSEVVYRQTTEDFLTALENAFRHFGGVPQTVVIDNLKAAVKHPDWFDPELVPKVAAFAAHYGTVILPTRPYTPRHKGKVERGIDYVQENALKGRTFKSLEEQNRHLEHWEVNVADTRIHGTTRRHVGRVFQEVEQAALLRLPAERFAFFHEGQRKVSRDGHVEVAKAYYSAPPEYLGRAVWVRWDARLVRIFNERFEQIALHVRHEPGRFSSLGEHLAPEKTSGIERGANWHLAKVLRIGPHAHDWACAMLQARGIAGVRVLMGLTSLAKRCLADDLERACETALSYGAFYLRSVRQLVKHQAPQQQSLPFLEEHPIIRPLEDYGRWLQGSTAPLPLALGSDSSVQETSP